MARVLHFPSGMTAKQRLRWLEKRLEAKAYDETRGPVGAYQSGMHGPDFLERSSANALK